MTTRLPLASLVLMLACTYDPKIPSGVIRCLPKNASDCPKGMACVASKTKADEGLCTSLTSLGDGGLLLPDAADDPADGGGPDAAIDGAPAPRDSVVADDVAPDATSGDLAPDGASADLVPAGDGAGLCPSTRGPVMVRASTFCIDSTEVTNRQYKEFLDAKGTDVGGQVPACAANRTFEPPPTVHWPAPLNRSEHPVVNVDWCDAAAFCQWSGKRLCGRIGGGSVPINFPTDPKLSQWYNACSHDGERLFPYGSTYNADLCYVKGDLQDSVAAGSSTMCEGGYPGLFDMAGNVEEWIDSCRTMEAAGPCVVIGGSLQSPAAPQPGCRYSYEDARIPTVASAASERRGFRCCSP